MPTRTEPDSTEVAEFLHDIPDAGPASAVEGRVLAERYRLVRVLGQGGMGKVWLAEHVVLKTPVAIKLMESKLARYPAARARFSREAHLAARIKSAHVVQVFDHGTTPEGHPFIAMEHLAGESLRERLNARKRLSVGETAKVLAQVARGVSRAHEAGLVHRDLKPENVFLVREGDEETAKVLDFGVAKASDAIAIEGMDPTRSGALLGTPQYMSPEQAQGLKTVDARSDQWSLGVLAFECLTGKRPFRGSSLPELVLHIVNAKLPVASVVAPDAAIPPAIDAWIARALSRPPEQRFASVQELADSFVAASGTRRGRRWFTVLALVLAVAALVAAAFLIGASLGR